MKLSYTALLAATTSQISAQSAGMFADNNQVQWTDVGEGKDGNTGAAPDNPTAESLDLTVYTATEDSNEQDDIDAYIETQRKKNQGIYDPNMYPYGPLHGDYRAPGADDAVSDAISLPSAFPFFGGQQTNKIRASTNGMIILGDRQIFENNPSELPSVAIDTPFVAGFWNDIWSKKQGKIYWRLEQSNTTLLDEMKSDIITGFPEMAGMGDLKYAFIFSFWRVTHFGARKANGMKQNTFQICITTDGKYSFQINNYQDIAWNVALGTENKAVAGFDIDNTYYTMIEGSLEDGSLDWPKRSTNSDTSGRHIFRLDDLDVPMPPTPPPVNPGEKGVVIADNVWPSNDNTLGGGIFHYIPENPIGNGTCTIQFPSPPAWFHVFDGHIRADAAVTSMVWKVVAANPTFEPNQETGAFNFAVQFNRGFEFTADEITMTCDTDDEFVYAVYSFPQNHLQQDGRSNLRKRDNVWDPTASYALTFASPVANFTLDDPRITVSTADNMSFVLTDVPPSLEEVWFQFSYMNYFGSNEVGVVGDQ